MSDQDNINKFDGFFKDHFEEFEPSSPGDAWSNIERKLPATPAGKSYLVWLFVAAVVIAGLLLYFNTQESKPAVSNVAGTESSTPVVKPDVTEVNPDKNNSSSPARSGNNETIQSDADNSVEGNPIHSDENGSDADHAKDQASSLAAASKDSPTGGTAKKNDNSTTGPKNKTSGDPQFSSGGNDPFNNNGAGDITNPPLLPLVKNPAPLVKPPVTREVYFTVSDSNTCTGKQLTFKNLSGEQFSKFSWEFGDGSTSVERSPKHVFTKPGIYQVVLRTYAGEEQKKFSRKITVSKVEALFATEISAMPVCSFANLSIGADRYLWDFGDGSRSTDRDPVHKYIGMKNLYTVKLIALTNNGCSDTSVTAIRNLRENETDGMNPEIPNVFTPDGDGYNDKLVIRIEGEVYYHLVVLSREGAKVFESYDKNNQWDGEKMNSGNPCTSGTYIYLFTYQLENKPVVKARGTVHMIR